MSKYLITGGAGFIGSHLADSLAANPNNLVTIVDNLLTGHSDNISQIPNIQFIKADANNLTEMSQVFYLGNFDYVFHYAAVVGVKRTLQNPLSVMRDLDGFKNVLELSVATGVKRVFYASSSEVYGEPVEIPQHEERTPLNARLPYAIVKNTGEAFLRSYHHEHGLDYTIFRFFNTYGPRQSSDFVMSKFLDAGLAGNDITIYGNGQQTRTFLYVADNVQATINALNDESSLNNVVNIGSETEMTINDLAEIIAERTGNKSDIIHLPALKEGDMTRRQPDVVKMKRLLGRPFTELEHGIQQLINYKTADWLTYEQEPEYIGQLRTESLVDNA
ncbi:MAG TPA: NAD-dependent epimerase/dehydratase family protein [Candidatus Saccharimonadales bacterium]|nr:NAD-dependent epimerase/dehydratase family protein [Candidatus Saccharimonadales bacterium]